MSHPVRSLVAFSSAVALVFMCGCGGQGKLEQAESRIAALTEKGLPDSLLAGAKVYLYQAQSAKKVGNSGVARRSTDSLMMALATAEGYIQEELARIKPQVDSLRSSIGTRKQNLSGLQLRQADSLVTILDSLIAKNWLLQAREKALALDTTVASLLRDEETMQKLLPTLYGTWTSVMDAKGEGRNAVEKRVFTFAKDKSLEMTEEMKGKTSEFLKEDWKFRSWGTYDMKGDTVLLRISREKCEKQVYETFREKNGKRQWIREEKPTYDTTITDASKDRFVTFDYLKENFSRK